MRTRLFGRKLTDWIEMTSLRCAMVFALIWVAFFAFLTSCIPDDPPNVQGHNFDHSSYTVGH
ncbi:hypothetical protein WYO_0206 [Methylobacterium sp. GXF4]|nr:hypothetical protein WYO_0206 [Methylobacterium sp. GXF4]